MAIVPEDFEVRLIKGFEAILDAVIARFLRDWKRDRIAICDEVPVGLAQIETRRGEYPNTSMTDSTDSVEPLKEEVLVKGLDEVTMKSDEKSDGLDKSKRGLLEDDATKVSIKFPKDKSLSFEKCDAVNKGLDLSPVKGHGRAVDSRERNNNANWILNNVKWMSPVDIRNLKTSWLPHGQGITGITVIHNVKFQLRNKVLVESDDSYVFRLFVMGNELLRVDIDYMKHLNEVELNDPYRFRLLLMGVKEHVSTGPVSSFSWVMSALFWQRKKYEDAEAAFEVIAEALQIRVYSDQLLEMKAGALLILGKYVDVIQTYVFWNGNEPFKAEMQKFTEEIVDMMKAERSFKFQGGPIILS